MIQSPASSRAILSRAAPGTAGGIGGWRETPRLGTTLSRGCEHFGGPSMGVLFPRDPVTDETPLGMREPRMRIVDRPSPCEQPTFSVALIPMSESLPAF